ncbi:MAG: imidazole glycerol phosphate synthase subunit HisH [Pedobacter sp.]|nr:MAG: imidazole glycerol phosphate synthase subunit HisH [Pedobacter sp.]
MSKEVVIVDYGLGNLYSIGQACNHLGYSPVISSSKEQILNSDYLILPGVGAFKVAIDHLTDRDLINTIKAFANSGKPIMGVCLGMQLLFDRSEEFGSHDGLGLIAGEIKKIPLQFEEQKIKIPHIGWNKLFHSQLEWSNTPLEQITEDNFMYFVHSYYAKPLDESNILSYTYYQGFKYCSSVQKNNIFGFQFHPEKSGEQGLSIYKNFLSR